MSYHVIPDHLSQLMKIDLRSREGEEAFRDCAESSNPKVTIYGLCYGPGEFDTPATLGPKKMESIFFRTSDPTSPVLPICPIVFFFDRDDFDKYVPCENQRAVMYEESNNGILGAVVRGKKYYANIPKFSNILDFVEFGTNIFDDADNNLTDQLADMTKHIEEGFCCYGIISPKEQSTCFGKAHVVSNGPPMHNGVEVPRPNVRSYLISTRHACTEGLDACTIIVTDDPLVFADYESKCADKVVALCEQSSGNTIIREHKINRYVVTAQDIHSALAAIELERSVKFFENYQTYIPTVDDALASDKPIYSIFTSGTKESLSEGSTFWQFMTNDFNHPVLKKSAVIAVTDSESFDMLSGLPKEVGYRVLKQYKVPFVILTASYENVCTVAKVEENMYKMTTWKYAFLAKELHEFAISSVDKN